MTRRLRNLLINRVFEEAFQAAAAIYLQGRLIDIGCGTKPYQAMLKPYVTEHIGVDHEGTFHDQSQIDLFGSAYQIPVEDATFDSAICTAVLEHLEEPEAALCECHRVLKPGGMAIYSVPFIFHLHEEPRDFFRYSKYGLRYLFEKVHFEVVELKALSGFWLTFGQMFVYYLYRFNRGPLRWLRLIDGLGLVIQATAYGLDRIDKAEHWTWMYMIVVRKR